MNLVGNEFEGMGDIEQIISLQDALNHAYQQVDEIGTKTANIGWTVDPGIGVPAIQKLVANIDKPGAIKIIPPGLLKPDEAPQLPAYLVRRIEDIVQRIMDVSGISEILMGSGRVTHRTARGIERLFEAGSSRIGQSIQFNEESVGEVAKMMAQTVVQFYKSHRLLPIFDDQGKISETLEIDGESFDATFEASIDSGAALPRDKQSRADLVFGLQKMGVFEMALSPDPVTKEIARVILDAVEFPGREKLLRSAVAQQQPPPQPLPPVGAAPTGVSGIPGPPPPGMSGPAMPGGAPIAPGVPPGAGFPPEVIQMAQAAGMTPEELVMQIQNAVSSG
jgi:hypothetical protein